MKKLLVLCLALLLIAPASFAKGTGGIAGFGVDVFGTPYMRLAMSEDMALDLGLGYTSVGAAGGAASTGTLNLLVRLNSVLLKVGNSVSAYWGAVLGYNTVSAAATTSTLTLAGQVGAEYAINDNVGLYGDVTVLSFQSLSTAGTGTSNFNLLTGGALAYTGLRVYL